MAGNILNFSTSRLITGINVIDGMLLWTDNETEPHKINIEKFKGNFDGVNVDHSSGTTQIYNRPFELRDITVLKEHPTESLQSEFQTLALIDTVDIIDDDGDGDKKDPKDISKKNIDVRTSGSYQPSVVETPFYGVVENTRTLEEGGFYWSHTNTDHKTIKAGLKASPPTSFKIVTDTNVIQQDPGTVNLKAIIQSADSSASNKNYNANLTTGGLSFFAFGKEQGSANEIYGAVININVKASPSAQSGTTTDFIADGIYDPLSRVILNASYITNLTVSSQGFYISKPYVNSNYGAPTLEEIIKQADLNNDPDKPFPGKYEARDFFGNSTGTASPAFSKTINNGAQGGYTYYFVAYLIDKNGTQYSDSHTLTSTVTTKVKATGAKRKPGLFNLSGVGKVGGADIKAEIFNTGFTGANISDYGFYFSTTISDPYDLVDEFSQGINANGTPSKTGAAANTFKISCSSISPLQTNGVGGFSLDTTSAVQNLAPGTTIYYLAYATNAGGEALAVNHGSVSQFSYYSASAEIAQVQVAKDADAPIIQITELEAKSTLGLSYATKNSPVSSGGVSLASVRQNPPFTSSTTAFGVKVHFAHSPTALGTPKTVRLKAVRPYGNLIDLNNFEGFKTIDDIDRAMPAAPDGRDSLLFVTGSSTNYPPIGSRLFTNGATLEINIDSAKRLSGNIFDATIFQFNPDSSTSTNVTTTNFLGEYTTDFRFLLKDPSYDDALEWEKVAIDRGKYSYTTALSSYAGYWYQATSFIAEVEYENGKIFRSEIKYALRPGSKLLGGGSGNRCAISNGGAPMVNTYDSTGDSYLNSSLTQNSVKLLGQVAANARKANTGQQPVQDIGFYYSTDVPPKTATNFLGGAASSNKDLDTWAASASKVSLTSSTSPTTIAQAQAFAQNADPDQSDANIHGCWRNYAADITGLSPNTTYYFAAFAKPSTAPTYGALLNLGGDALNATKYGAVQELTTEGTGSIVDHPPTINILDYKIDSRLSKVFFTGQAIPEGKNYKVNEVGFYMKPKTSFPSTPTESQILTELANATSRITISGSQGGQRLANRFEGGTVLATTDHYACAFATFKINGGNITNPILSNNSLLISLGSNVRPQSLIPDVRNVKWERSGKNGSFYGEVTSNTSGITAAGFYIIGKEGGHLPKAFQLAGGPAMTTSFPMPDTGADLKTIFDSPPSGVITHNLQVTSSKITDPFSVFIVPFREMKFDFTYYAAAYATNSDGTAIAGSCIRVHHVPPPTGSFGFYPDPPVLEYDADGNQTGPDIIIGGKSYPNKASNITVSSLPVPGKWKVKAKPAGVPPNVPKGFATELFGTKLYFNIVMKDVVNNTNQDREFKWILEHENGETATVTAFQRGRGTAKPVSPLFDPLSFDNPNDSSNTSYNP